MKKFILTLCIIAFTFASKAASPSYGNFRQDQIDTNSIYPRLQIKDGAIHANPWLLYPLPVAITNFTPAYYFTNLFYTSNTIFCDSTNLTAVDSAAVIGDINHPATTWTNAWKIATNQPGKSVFIFLKPGTGYTNNVTTLKVSGANITIIAFGASVTNYVSSFIQTDAGSLSIYGGYWTDFPNGSANNQFNTRTLGTAGQFGAFVLNTWGAQYQCFADVFHNASGGSTPIFANINNCVVQSRFDIFNSNLGSNSVFNIENSLLVADGSPIIQAPGGNGNPCRIIVAPNAKVTFKVKNSVLLSIGSTNVGGIGSQPVGNVPVSAYSGGKIYLDNCVISGGTSGSNYLACYATNNQSLIQLSGCTADNSQVLATDGARITFDPVAALPMAGVNSIATNYETLGTGNGTWTNGWGVNAVAYVTGGSSGVFDANNRFLAAFTSPTNIPIILHPGWTLTNGALASGTIWAN